MAVGPSRASPRSSGGCPEAARARREIKRIEKGEVGAINHEQEKIRLGLRRLALGGRDERARRSSRSSGRWPRCRRGTRSRKRGSRELRERQTASVVVVADGGRRRTCP